MKKFFYGFMILFMVFAIPTKAGATDYKGNLNGYANSGIEFVLDEETSGESNQYIALSGSNKLPITGEYATYYFRIIGISVILCAYLYKKYRKRGIK